MLGGCAACRFVPRPSSITKSPTSTNPGLEAVSYPSQRRPHPKKRNAVPPVPHRLLRYNLRHMA
eukprot:4167465-Prorocentrum_lima.AAC.1